MKKCVVPVNIQSIYNSEKVTFGKIESFYRDLERFRKYSELKSFWFGKIENLKDSERILAEIGNDLEDTHSGLIRRT